MSAYLVQAHHAAYLAHYYAARCLQWGSISGAPSDVADVAEYLARANMASMRARYGDDGCGDPAAYVAECRRAAMLSGWPSFEPAEVIKAAHCFDYQACEVSDYDHAIAAQITRTIASHAAMDLPGYDGAPWGAPEPLKARQPAKVTRTVPSLAALATTTAKAAKPRRHGLYIVK